MFLKPHQMYLESQGLYQKVCRLAQVRTEIKALTVEEDRLVKCIHDAMCPATEIVDLVFLRSQKDVSEADLDEMFVARWQEAERIMDVHPAYVSDRFRPGNNMPDAPVTIETEKEAESSKEEEREAAATLSQKKAEAQKEGAPVVVTDDAAAASSSEINIDAFIKFFNQTMQEARAVIPQIQCLQGKRLEALRARCREFSKKTVMQVIRDAARSPFLNGNGSRGWRASIDWILKPNNFPRIMEGLYFDIPKKTHGLSPELLAINREIERQIHADLHRRLDEQRRGAVTYEEYQRMKAAGEI